MALHELSLFGTPFKQIIFGGYGVVVAREIVALLARVRIPLASPIIPDSIQFL